MGWPSFTVERVARFLEDRLEARWTGGGACDVMLLHNRSSFFDTLFAQPDDLVTPLAVRLQFARLRFLGKHEHLHPLTLVGKPAAHPVPDLHEIGIGFLHLTGNHYGVERKDAAYGNLELAASLERPFGQKADAGGGYILGLHIDFDLDAQFRELRRYPFGGHGNARGAATLGFLAQRRKVVPPVLEDSFVTGLNR